MKRHGFLFEQAFSRESLYQAWLDASKGKHAKRACLEFSRRLATNLDALYNELHGGTYQPQPYIAFQVCEPKQRTIYAPAFRDLVVQHAIYRLVYPIYNTGFIDQSFACRVGKGTHRAADYAQAALRASPPGSYTLKLDIRKFFYRIDRAILQRLLGRKVKDARLLRVMMQFADYGPAIGIPIGNLLSQMYALVYMSPLDHFIKRTLGARLYCRYVDDFVVFGWPRERCVQALRAIRTFLADKLHLELSRYSIQPLARGLNFVGYRTWRTTRFIRKHSLRCFTRSARRGQLASVISILGHAQHTGGLRHLLTTLKEQFHDLFDRLPQTYRRRYHPHPAHT
jgi:RNA-directed DNA polymerase